MFISLICTNLGNYKLLWQFLEIGWNPSIKYLLFLVVKHSTILVVKHDFVVVKCNFLEMKHQIFWQWEYIWLIFIDPYLVEWVLWHLQILPYKPFHYPNFLIDNSLSYSFIERLDLVFLLHISTTTKNAIACETLTKSNFHWLWSTLGLEKMGSWI